MTVANSRCRPDRQQGRPRNMAAAERSRECGEVLVVSFIGDTPWACSTVYCDSGRRYDWDFVRGLSVVVAVRPGVVVADALHQILEATDTIKGGYPVLVDVDAQEVACVVHGRPVGLWQIKRGSALWQQYF